MNAHTASLINAFTLIIMGGWGFFGNPARPTTALIPVFIGVLLIVCNNGIKYQHKIMSHVAVVLTLLITIALFKPLMSAISAENTMGIVRIALMILTSIVALVFFIKSFSAARAARKN